MFHKILIANRGTIAVRVIRTCREMGIPTVALYEAPDINSLHVRLADECALLENPLRFYAAQEIIEIAQQTGADAIHPGAGYLAERADFVRACEQAGFAFIGPPLETLQLVQDKASAQDRARRAGFPTLESLHATGKEPAGGSNGQPGYWVSVHVLGDCYGNLVQLGECQELHYPANQKLVAEMPAPCLAPYQRETLHTTALELARLFQVRNAASIEFRIGPNGKAYFSEVKASLPVEYSLTEMIQRIDLVREQICLAAGQPLALRQSQVASAGAGLLCRIKAENPERDFEPCPGALRQVRFPGGNEVRVDAHIYSGCDVPGIYDPLLGLLTVWAPDREACLQRMYRALQDFRILGPLTNLPLLRALLQGPDFVCGKYGEITGRPDLLPGEGPDSKICQDLAVIAGLLHEQRSHRPAPAPLPPENYQYRPRPGQEPFSGDYGFMRRRIR